MVFASHFPESAERTTTTTSPPVVAGEKPWSKFSLPSLCALYPETGPRVEIGCKRMNHNESESPAKRAATQPYERPPTPPPCTTAAAAVEPAVESAVNVVQPLEPPHPLPMHALYHQQPYLPPYLAPCAVPFQPYDPAFRQPVHVPHFPPPFTFQPPAPYVAHIAHAAHVPSYTPHMPYGPPAAPRLPVAFEQAEFTPPPPPKRTQLDPAPKLTSPIFLEPTLQNTEQVTAPTKPTPAYSLSRPFFHYVPAVSARPRKRRRPAPTGMPTPDELDQKNMNDKQLAEGSTGSKREQTASDSASEPTESCSSTTGEDTNPLADPTNDHDPEPGQQSSAGQDVLDSPKSARVLPSPPESPFDSPEPPEPPKTCISCGCSQSPCWRPSWSPAVGQLCNSCGLRYKKTGARCLNTTCGKIPSKGEWNMMARSAQRDIYGQLQYSCLSCQGPVLVTR